MPGGFVACICCKEGKWRNINDNLTGRQMDMTVNNVDISREYFVLSLLRSPCLSYPPFSLHSSYYFLSQGTAASDELTS